MSLVVRFRIAVAIATFAVSFCQADPRTKALSSTAGLPASVATVQGSPTAEDGAFSIAVLPDTQYYAQKYPDTFHAQTQWIADSVTRYNIQFVLQLGDITETAADREWKVAQEAFARIDGHVPYSLAPGNHDYGGRLQIVAHRSPFSTFFPLAHFQKMPSFGGVYDKQPDKADNHFHTFDAGGRKWLIIALEFAPRNDVLRWANDVVAAHPAHSAIIITHAYLEPGGNHRILNFGGVAPKQRTVAAPVSAPPAEIPDVNLGEAIWQKFASKHSNVMMVICGHVSYTNHRTDKGVAGNTVHEIVVDYQRDVNGGNGWMRLLQFLPDGKTVRSRDFSPTLGLTSTMPDRTYDFELGPAPAVKAN